MIERSWPTVHADGFSGKMRIILFLSFLLFLSSCSKKTEEDPYLLFLKDQRKSAKEYILNLFEQYDIVVLCERNHKEFTQYELFRDIVKDSYFVENVGHVFTEVGVSNMDSIVNSFLYSESHDSLTVRKKVTSIFREIDSSPYWHCYSYPWFLTEIHKINQTLPANNKLSWHPSDTEFDWSKCRNAEDYKAYDDAIVNRDSMMAQNIIKRLGQVNSNVHGNKKAMVIMNYKHAFLKDHRFDGRITHNTARYLADHYKGKVASIYIMGLAIPERGVYTIVKDGKWDFCFEVSNKTDVGFNLENSPFGSAEFDVIPPDSLQRFKYQDQFTGLVFFKPVHERYFKTGWQGFATDDFIPELRRRIDVYNQALELGLTNDDIEAILFKNNIEETIPYEDLATLRKKIDQWGNRAGVVYNTDH